MPTQPDWEARIPGEQWMLMDSESSAEAYLATYKPSEAKIYRETYPNPEHLYARISFPGRIPQHHLYIAASED